MRQNQPIVKYVAFILMLVLSITTICITVPAEEILPAPPVMDSEGTRIVPSPSASTVHPTILPAPPVMPSATPTTSLVPTPQPMPEPMPSPTPEPTPSPTPELTPSPIPEPTPSPTLESTPSPTPEPTPSPTPVETALPDTVASADDLEAVPDEDEIVDEDEELQDIRNDLEAGVEPDEELAFIDDIIEDAYLSDDALKAVDGMTHILLVGLDARPKEKTGRSDTMIILTLDAKNGSLKMTSLMRDLYVEIPGRKNNRLNSAYLNGGPELLMKTIEKNFGIKIDHYVAVNFSVLASVIDQIGGLTLNVEQKYVPRINAVIKQDNKVLKKPLDDGLLKESGEQLLTGKQAQAYARYRYGTKDGDFGRTVRQREVILKALDKVQKLSMTQLVRLALNNMDQISTDMSITDMIRLAPAAFQLRAMEVKELRIPIDKGYSSKTISGMSVLVPDRTRTRQAINKFLMDDAK